MYAATRKYNKMRPIDEAAREDCGISHATFNTSYPSPLHDWQPS